MRRFATLFSGLALVGWLATAQERAETRFEVASVRPAGPVHEAPYVNRAGPGTDNPERITFERESMLRLLNQAYGLDWDQISGPASLASDYYYVDAKVPPGTTREQVRLMWQNLLAERFHLQTHFETREFPVYELSVAKGGPKLRKSGVEPARQMPGFPVLAPGERRRITTAPPRNVLQTYRNYSMAEFAQQLAWPLSMEGASGWVGFYSVGKVVNKTGLDGQFDFTLEFAGRWGTGGAYPQPLPNGESDTAPTLFDALRQQLGLKLEEKKTKLDVLVVDHVDRIPVEN